MKHITSIVAGCLFAVLMDAGVLSAKANAQNETAEIFTVPFAFTVDGHLMTAGTYELNLESDQFQLSIRNLKTGKQQFFTVRPEQDRTVASRGRLVFDGCGLKKDLTEFHTPGSNLYSTTIAPRHEAASDRGRCSETDTTTIAAR